MKIFFKIFFFNIDKYVFCFFVNNYDYSFFEIGRYVGFNVY